MAKRTRKQAYYQKEYSRLLAQAKKTYNEMSLGGIFGQDLPSFERILNYAGTRSGLKKPTKESLKALRKLKTEEDILWGIKHTLNKRSLNYETNIERLEKLQEVKEEADKSIKQAKKEYRKYQNKDYSKQERQKEQFDTFSPIEKLLAQLRFYHNYCTEHQYFYARGNDKRKKYYNEQERHYEYAKTSIEKLIRDIETILNSGDLRKIQRLSLGCAKFFMMYPGGVEVEMFYNPKDGEEIRENVFNGVNEAIESTNTTENNSPSNDEPYDDMFNYEDFF